MKKFLYLTITTLLIAVAHPAYAQTQLKDKLDKLVNEKLPPESEVGICVYDLTARQHVYSYRDKKLCRPASNMKILTVLTSLSSEDADVPFRTYAWYKGNIANNTLYGDIYIVGGYDPRFDEERMDSLVNRIASFPFTNIQGKIYGDVSMKDSLYWGAGWSWDDTPYYYQPYLTPLMFSKGIVEVVAKPGVAGDTASLKITPASSFYKVKNETQTRTADAGKFTVTRNWLENKNDIVVSGNVEGKRTGTVNMYPTQDFFMHVLTEKLVNKGIYCDTAYEYAEFVPDSSAVLMACLEQPIDKVLEDIMKESDNMATEALLCKLTSNLTGKKKVSTEEGLEFIEALIERVGHDPKNYQLGDACGLSDYNSISPALLVDLLKYAYADTELFQKFYTSLPIGGVDGTLKNRMRKGTKAYMNINAKTGSISGISTLSGYAKASNGHILAFSIMNQNTLTSAKARAFQDLVCNALCE